MTDSRDNQFADAHEGENDNGPDENGGLGPDGTIPADRDGVAAGYTGEPSTFEPEEDESAPDA